MYVDRQFYRQHGQEYPLLFRLENFTVRLLRVVRRHQHEPGRVHRRYVVRARVHADLRDRMRMLGDHQAHSLLADRLRVLNVARANALGVREEHVVARVIEVETRALRVVADGDHLQVTR